MAFIDGFNKLFSTCSLAQLKDIAFVVNEFAKEVENENDSVKLYQLNFLLASTKSENFLYTIFDAYKKKYNILHITSKIMDDFEKSLISPMVYSYFLYCVLTALKVEVRDFEWINPVSNTLVNETMNLEPFFGIGCFLESLDLYEIEENTLKRAMQDRAYLTVPHGVTNVDRNAFDDLTNLNFITFPDSVTELTEGNFYNKVSVQKVILSKKVKTIPTDFFRNAQGLSFVCGRGVTNIGANAFESTNITSFKNLAGIKIQKLGDYAFRDCFNLKKIHLPSLNEIGKAPFFNCMNISEILIDVNQKMIDNKVKIFNLFEYEANDLSNYAYFNTIIVNAKEGVLPDGFFENCSSVTHIKINGLITDAGVDTFKGCTSLTKLEMNFVGEKLADGMFEDCVMLEEFPKFSKTTHIGERSFKGCTLLEELSFAKPIETLGRSSFEGCNSLRNLGFKLIAKELPGYCFSGCAALIDFAFLNQIEVFKEYCLKGIELPTNFELKNHVEYIQENAFNGSIFASKIVIPKDCTIDKLAFANMPVVDTLICNNLEIKDINNEAVELYQLFENDKQLFLFKYSKLRNITINTDVIGANSFSYWHQIEHLSLSDKVNVIDTSAFEGCAMLKELTLSNTLLTIKSDAFKNCTLLSKIDTSNNHAKNTATYDLSTCIVIEEGAFKNCNCTDVYLTVQEDSTLNNINLGKVFNKDAKTNLSLTNVFVNVLGTTLPDGLFDGCNTVKNISIDGTISKLSNNLFKNCSSIDTLNLDFNGNVINSGCFENCINLKNLPVFHNVDTIETNSFKNCSSLTSVTFDKHITKIEESAFEGCNKLVETNFELHIKHLEANTFKNCNSIKDYFFIKEVEVFDAYSLSNLYLVDRFIPPHNTKRVCAHALDSSILFSEVTLRDDIIYEEECFSNVKGIHKLVLNNALFKNEEEFLIFRLFANTIEEFNKNYGSINSVTLNSNNICDNAFMGWTHLVNVEITNEVKKLPVSCFEGCSLIHEIKLPYYNITLSQNTFANCLNLNKVVYENKFIESNVTEIPKNVFANCKKITEISIYLDEFIYNSNINLYSYFTEDEKVFNKQFSKLKTVNLINNIKELPNGFFKNCKNIVTINIENEVDKLGSELFMNCISLHNLKLNFIGTILSDNLFNNCIKLTHLESYKTVEKIGSYSFSGCKKLSSLTFEKEISNIKDNAFENCISLNSINLSYTGTKIGKEIFLNCKKLIESPKLLNLESIDQTIFNGCKKMKTVHINGFTNITLKDMFVKNKTINNIYFYGEVIPTNFFKDFNNNSLLHFNDEIKVISNNAFENCSIIKELTNLNSIEEIGIEAFKASGLTNIVIPACVKDFSPKIFADCTSLVSVDIPGRFDFLGALFSTEEYPLSRELRHKSFGVERVYYIPKTLKTISINSGEVVEGSFSNVDLELIINVKLNRIKDYAFYNCSNLTLPYITDIKQVGDQAFAHSKIDVLNLSSVTTIGHSSFKDCIAKEIIIGNKISELQPTSFIGTKFESFVIEKNIFYKLETNILIDIKKTMILNVFDCDFDLVIPSEIQTLEANTFASINIKNIDTNNVRTIKGNAFVNLLTLESIRMPKVERFGASIFSNCPNIKNIETSFMGIEKTTPKYLDYFFDVVPKNFNKIIVNGGTITMNAFRNIDNINELNLLSVKQDCFEENTFRNIKINNLTMPKQLTTIADNAFFNVEIGDVICSNDSIRYENNVIIASNKMVYCPKLSQELVVVDNSIVDISKTTFKLCTNVSNIELLNTNISYLEVFDNVKGIKKLSVMNIKENITNIFKRTFTEIEEIVYLDSVISDQFFKGINSYKKLVFNNINKFNLSMLTNPLTALKVKKILINELVYNTTLNEIDDVFEYVQVNKMSIVNSEDYFIEQDVLYDNKDKCLVYASKCANGNIIAPQGITKTSNEAFKDCVNINSVVLSDVLTIGDNLFENCTSLNKLDINSSCETIGKTILKNCNNFKSITIPFIGNKANKLDNLSYLFGKDIFDVNIKLIKLTNHEIINNTFNNYHSINSIILCNNTTTINEQSFVECNKLHELYLAPSITTLPDYAFIGSPKSLKVIVDKDIALSLGDNWSKFGEDKKAGGIKVVAKKQKPEFFI